MGSRGGAIFLAGFFAGIGLPLFVSLTLGPHLDLT
jgi:hypothetical protein